MNIRLNQVSARQLIETVRKQLGWEPYLAFGKGQLEHYPDDGTKDIPWLERAENDGGWSVPELVALWYKIDMHTGGYVHLDIFHHHGQRYERPTIDDGVFTHFDIHESELGLTEMEMVAEFPHRHRLAGALAFAHRQIRVVVNDTVAPYHLSLLHQYRGKILNFQRVARDVQGSLLRQHIEVDGSLREHVMFPLAKRIVSSPINE